MNNAQFRHLLDISKPRPSKDGSSPSSSSQASRFGSRPRSSALLTPRALANPKNKSSTEFSRQVAQHKRAFQQPATNARPSASVPKGTKFGPTYQDRAALLRQDGSSETEGRNDHTAERIKALEDIVRLRQIDDVTFEKLRDEIGIGGEVESTHLVKGLDWKLLRRVRDGEDVLAVKGATGGTQGGDTEDKEQDIDNGLEEALEKEVQPMRRYEEAEKSTTLAPSIEPMRLGQMSRNEILKKLKASRTAAAHEMNKGPFVKPVLGSKFRKIEKQDAPDKRTFVEEINGRRREVLLTTNPDGTTKRKIKWIDQDGPRDESNVVLETRELLGADIPEEIVAKQKERLAKMKEEEDDDQDIFAGVGADYDPFGGSGDESEEKSNPEEADEARVRSFETNLGPAGTTKPSRDYFSTRGTEEESKQVPSRPAADPQILAGLGKAAAIRKAPNDTMTSRKTDGLERSSGESEFLAKLRKREREDAADIDLGFGESRFGDEEDEDGPIWDDEEGQKSRQAGRKRGPKKRKGKKNDVRDVMSAIERGRN